MKKLFLITGKAKHGKDSVAGILKDKLESHGERVLILHFADYLKFICKEYFGWDGQKDDKGRTLLQLIGTDKVRSKDPNFWVNIICDLISVLKDDFDYFIVSDCRFPGELSVPKEYGFDTISVRVTRYEDNVLFDNGLTFAQKIHSSECSLDTHSFDYELQNDGNLHWLQYRVDDFIEYFNL